MPPARVTAASRRSTTGRLSRRTCSSEALAHTASYGVPSRSGSVRSSRSGSTTSAVQPAEFSCRTNAGVMSVRRTFIPICSSASASRPGPEPISSTREPGASPATNRATLAATLSGITLVPAA